MTMRAHWATCLDCGGKRAFGTRRAAKATAKTIPGDHMTAYRCPSGLGWHLGHLPRDIVQGRASKADYEARVEQRRAAAS